MPSLSICKPIFYGSRRISPILGFAITNIIKIFNKYKFKGWLFKGISGEFSIFVYPQIPKLWLLSLFPFVSLKKLVLILNGSMDFLIGISNGMSNRLAIWTTTIGRIFFRNSGCTKIWICSPMISELYSTSRITKMWRHYKNDMIF